jgi:hypothetical protein
LDFSNENLTELFPLLGLTFANNRFTFGFGVRKIDINFQFWRHFEEKYYLNIGLEKERFIYEFEEEKWAINYTTHGVSKFITKENDFKNYYRALLILIKSKAIIQDFVDKKNNILNATEQIIKPLFPAEFPFIYKSVKAIYEEPSNYRADNKAFFDDLNISFMDWSFQKQALLHILKQTDIALVINGKEYISAALNDLEIWFKKRDFDIETDWKARGLYLKRRIEYFSKDVLIVNEICKEKNIPLSILDFSMWLNDRFIVFFPVRNADKELFLEWLNAVELTK